MFLQNEWRGCVMENLAMTGDRFLNNEERERAITEFKMTT